MDLKSTVRWLKGRSGSTQPAEFDGLVGGRGEPSVGAAAGGSVSVADDTDGGLAGSGASDPAKDRDAAG